jgi:membrane-bound lytic murein transglycosylase A
VVAQDTGGAIKGPLRADLFWGHGDHAEYAAGVMKETGSMIVLLPRE